MEAREIEIVTTLHPHIAPYRVGVDGVSRIEMRADGHGLTGFYDVIHVYATDPDHPWVSLPAHNCLSWQYQ